MARNVIVLKTINKDEIKGYSWTIQNPIANVIIVEGMEEHVERYDDFANFLNTQGFNVYAIDHYGHGLNVDQGLGIVPDSFFSKSVRNIDDTIKKIVVKNIPNYVFGHSMGSFMVQDFIQRFPNDVDKVVICGTNGPNADLLFKLGYKIAKLLTNDKNRNTKSKFLTSLAIGSYSKAIKNRKTDSDWLSYNEDNVRKYVDNPLDGFGSPRGFYREFLKGNARLYKAKFLAKINPDVKVLIIAGKDDPVGAYGKGPKALAECYKDIGVKDVQLEIYENMRHEILNENDHDKVYNRIVEFLK